MKKFTSPEWEMIRLDVIDVITASGEAAPSSTAAAPNTTAKPTVSDAGLDNEVSANKWVF